MSGLPSELTLVLRTCINYRADLTLVMFIAMNYTLIEFYYRMALVVRMKLLFNMAAQGIEHESEGLELRTL